MTLRSYAQGAVFAEQVGSAPPEVLFLHGWGRDRHDMLHLARGFDSLVPDLPGFGASPPPEGVAGGAEYAAEMSQVLEEAGVAAPVVVVAHSFGGRVAVCLASARPDLVGALVLCGVPLLRLGARKKPSLGYRAVRAGHRLGIVSDARLERWKQARGSADYKSASGVMRDILTKAVNETYEAELAGVLCPVAFVWGADDSAAPAAIVSDACGLVAGPVTVDIVDGADHDIHRQHPELLVLRARELLEKIRS